jgi:hypothetical protein
MDKIWKAKPAQMIYSEMVQDAERARDQFLADAQCQIDVIESTRIKFMAYKIYAEMKAKAVSAASETEAAMLFAAVRSSQ